ncbi:zinc-dependent peptidase [Pseudomonas sp. ABC1]|uniref:M90 family metallopeptidase n=1 Tax=Pseudomonas sp. ABC1 TaxID=2748080 RepID=UPI0015C2EE23|nr:M90 family metallopeptidase [Pseudomonas sp. ABC1]QLF94083.1 zinc-dependent peptidase [Pseudomonas sp. ABC1]
MWSFRAWRRQRLLKRYPIAPELWNQVFDSLPILDGLDEQDLQLLRERAVLFLHAKRLTPLPDVTLEPLDRLRLAVMAELPLLALSEALEWYQGFHEVLIYPEDFLSPQKYRDPSGVEHEWDAEHSGEAWLQGPVILAWPGVQESGGWEGYNLVIHELAHKLDMLNGDANGLPPLHGDMHIEEWARVMQAAYDAMNATLDHNPHAHTPIDPYAAENPAEFFAVTSEYFFCAPDLLEQAFPEVYAQLRGFYRQDPLARLNHLRQRHPAYADNAG